MPPKGKTSAKTAHRHEVHEKVKEIKQRQQNWLRQRETALKSGDDVQEAVTLTREERTSASKTGTGVHFAAATHKPDRATESVDRHQSGARGGYQPGPRDGHKPGARAGFKAWMKATQETPKHELGKSYVVADGGTASAQPESHRPLSPAQFDDVADRIACRVKNELSISSVYDASNYGGEAGNRAPVRSAAGQPAGRVSVASVAVERGGHSSEDSQAHLNSHICPQCSKLMVGGHEPMLVVPCGHSVCRACAEDDDLCPVCACEIASVTANIMLKQVIADFQRQAHRKNASSRAHSAASTVDSQTDYSEELRSLMLRLEVLESECDNIHDTMRVIQQDIASEHAQIERIEDQENQVKKEMENLGRKLDSLGKHKESYQDNVEGLEEQRGRQQEKLNMVRQTIRDLNRSVEQIQLKCNKG